MTGTCLIKISDEKGWKGIHKISDVLTLCRSHFKILSGALPWKNSSQLQHSFFAGVGLVSCFSTANMYRFACRIAGGGISAEIGPLGSEGTYLLVGLKYRSSAMMVHWGSIN